MADTYVNKDGLTYYTGKVKSEINAAETRLRALVGTPLTASTAASMTDTDKIYVYTGSETGYTAGNWYYHNGTAWVSGGVYNSTAVETDKTLSVPDMAADAKAVGDELTDLKDDLSKLDDTVIYGKYKYNTFVSGTRGINIIIFANSTRCTVADVFTLKVGDKISVFNIPSGYKCVIAGVKNGSFIYDSGWKTEDFDYVVSSGKEGVYFINVAASNGTDDISPSDITALYLEICPYNLFADKKQDKNSDNLIGMQHVLYPIDETSVGDVFTYSTEDSTAIGFGADGYQVNLNFYDAYKRFLSYYSFQVGNTKRTITVNAAVAGARYLMWDHYPQKNIMLVHGSSAKPYSPYFMDLPYLSEYVMGDGEDVVTLHNNAKADTYAIKRAFSASGNDTDNAFKALWVSDIHAEATKVERMVVLANAWGNGFFDLVINTGDTVATLQTNGLEWYDNLIDKSAIPVLNTVGNHDAWTALTGTLAPATDVYNMIISPITEQTTIVQPSNAETNGYNYYYKDVGGIRVIVLDCMYYDATELAWFENVLDDAKTNALPVVTCIHAPFASQYCELIESKWNVGWFHRDSTVSNIALASAVKTFIDDGGTFICWLMGHIHGDEFETLPEYGNQLCLCINSFTNRGTTVVKSQDIRLSNYDCLTFFTVDKVNHYVKVYRIGANIDTAGHRRNGFVWDYVNKQPVTEW